MDSETRQPRHRRIFISTATTRPPFSLSPPVRMKIWAAILVIEVAAGTIALLNTDWSMLSSPLPLRATSQM